MAGLMSRLLEEFPRDEVILAQHRGYLYELDGYKRYLTFYLFESRFIKCLLFSEGICDVFNFPKKNEFFYMISDLQGVP